eukprot:TRINITY_DN3508_c0_g1_i1.p3 TRINITY_DN3508_c0_g1~~TRINITY_DN3508_c0_g1_i1.p3  ORF type:complete len:141 (-),score=3.74 TRINITY_DN3508_c0_g1_i1:460-882(-)
MDRCNFLSSLFLFFSLSSFIYFSFCAWVVLWVSKSIIIFQFLSLSSIPLKQRISFTNGLYNEAIDTLHFIFNEMAMPTFTGGESVSQKTKTGMFTCDDSSMTIAYVLESKTPRSIGSKHFLGNCRVPGAHFHASSFTPLH